VLWYLGHSWLFYNRYGRFSLGTFFGASIYFVLVLFFDLFIDIISAINNLEMTEKFETKKDLVKAPDSDTRVTIGRGSVPDF